MLFLLKLPVSFCGLQIGVKAGVTGGCASALACVSHASVSQAVTKSGNTIGLSLTYEEKAQHKMKLIKFFVIKKKILG